MADNIKEIIAKNLLYYRKQQKMTQKQLADQLGVNNSAVSNWETGVNSIDIDTLFRACKILGVSVNDMYGVTVRPVPMTIAAHKEGGNFTPEELDKIEEYKRLLLAARPKK